MTTTPDTLRYTREHEWIRIEGNTATIGITDYAQGELGDVVYVTLPAVGAELKQMAVFGTVEAVKTVSDLYAPVSGKVVAVNAGLAEAPEKVNSSPYDDGWMIRVEVADPSEVEGLLTPAAYRAQLGQ
jgi:glycine cleavage system H protein